MAIKLTLKVAQGILRPNGITVRSIPETGEYRVAYSGKGNEASAYYTNDLADAVNTGWAMIRGKRPLSHPSSIYRS